MLCWCTPRLLAAGRGDGAARGGRGLGRAQGADIVRLDTYANSPVSVPFYEDRMGYQRRSVVFEKQL